MKVVRSEKNVTIYPTVKDTHRVVALKEAVVITPDIKYTRLLHREYKDNSWSVVQFSLNKEGLQQYINELQVICDTMEVSK